MALHLSVWRPLALAAFCLMLTAPATGQDDRLRRQVGELTDRVRALETRLDALHGALAHRDARHAELIERLEVGKSALRELGEKREVEHIEEIVRRLREGHRGADRDPDEPGDNEEVREVRRRLQVMRGAVEAFVEAGKQDWAHRVEQAMHARELAIARRDDDETRQIRAAAPHRGQLAELLAAAADLRAKTGDERGAEALSELSRVYGEQWRRRQRAEGSERQREPRRLALAERADRVAILRLARVAHAEKGHRDAADILERFLKVGELELASAPPEAIAEAAQGLSQGTLIELLQGASALYREWGHGDRAEACNALAEFYAKRQRERAR